MKKQKYMTVVKFYDGGQVKACVIPADADAESYYKNKPVYDEYGDIFDTRKEAEEWRQQAYQA